MNMKAISKSLSLSIYSIKALGIFTLVWLLGGIALGQQAGGLNDRNVSGKKESASDILTPTPHVGWQGRIKDISESGSSFEKTTQI